MRFIQVILKNLTHRGTRSALTISSLALAVTAMVGLLSIAWKFAESANQFYAERGVDIVAVRAGVSDHLTSSLRADLVTRLASLPEIAAADASLNEPISLGEGSLFGIPLYGFDPQGFAIRELTITAGRTLQARDRGCVLLGEGIAESLGKRPGQQVTVEGSPFEVVGIFKTDNPKEANGVIAPLPDVQQLMDRPGQVTKLFLRAQPQFQQVEAIRDLCRRLEQLRDEQDRPLGLKAQPARDFVQSETETKLATSIAWGSSAIVLVLSFLGIFNTMLMSVLERTREIGILRAVGWTRPRVVRMILGESLVLSVVAAAFGVAAAWILVQGFARWSATKAIVSPHLSLTSVLCGFGLALVAGLAGALYPAFHGASVPATEALRYE